MICKSCGRANEQGAKFCKSCGAPLEGGADVQQNNKVGYQQKNMGYQQYDMSGNMNFGTTRMTKEEFNQCANIKHNYKEHNNCCYNNICNWCYIINY